MKISVIVPCYNVADFISESVSSLLCQDYQDFDVVLVNDGSVDKTEGICRELAAGDSRIRLINQDNQGVVSARRNGFLQSTGEIILFVDADDQLERDALEVVSEAFETHEVDLVRFGYKKVDEHFALIHEETPELSGVKSLGEIRELGAGRFKRICSSSIWDKAYSSELAGLVFEKVGSVRINHSEDMLFSMASVIDSKRIYFEQKSLYLYRQREGSVIHSFNAHAVFAKTQYMDALAMIIDSQTGDEWETFGQELLGLEANEAVNYVLINSAKYGATAGLFRRTISDLCKTSFFRDLVLARKPDNLRQVLRNNILRYPHFAAFTIPALLRFRESCLRK